MWLIITLVCAALLYQCVWCFAVNICGVGFDIFRSLRKPKQCIDCGHRFKTPAAAGDFGKVCPRCGGEYKTEGKR